MSRTLEVKVDKNKILNWINAFGIKPAATVPLLQEVQLEYGHLPQDAMDIIVDNTEITGSQLFGVATFYSQFRLKPAGRHLAKICHGTACHVRGADRLNTAIQHTLSIPRDSDTSPTGAYTLEDVACVGCCSLAPVMVIDDEVFGELTGAAAAKKLKKHAKLNNEIL